MTRPDGLGQVLDGYAGCAGALGTLVAQSVTQVYAPGARPCAKPIGSPERTGDPCCNPSAAQCCAAADTQVNVTSTGALSSAAPVSLRPRAAPPALPTSTWARSKCGDLLRSDGCMVVCDGLVWRTGLLLMILSSVAAVRAHSLDGIGP